MPEFTFRERAEYSPTVCVACRTHKGPFIDLHLESITLGSATGMIDVDGHVYLCLGDSENPGCLPQMARTVGYLPPEIWEQERIGMELETDSLRRQLAEAQEKRVVSLGDVMAMVDATKQVSTLDVQGLGLDAEQGKTAEPVVVKRRPGRPRKHPLPNADASK